MTLLLNLVDNELCLQRVALVCGDKFCNVVKRCLEADIMERPRSFRKQETSIALKLQRIIEVDIVQTLERLAEAL